MKLDDLKLETEVIITGTASSVPMNYKGDRRFVDLKGMVASISKEDENIFIKLWADIEGETEKVWFKDDQIESLTIISEEN